MADESAFRRLVRAIAAGDIAAASAQVSATPPLATARAEFGATRENATDNFLTDIRHYIYGGDTALHIAAAAYATGFVQTLIDAGSDVSANNRRGASPLHYAADGSPGSSHWNPDAQSATIVTLIAAGADPNAIDNSGVAPLHRAVRTRCAAAVDVLIANGADPLRPNKSGSTPLMLATQTTGRSGSGSPDAKAQQEQIVLLLSRFSD